MYCINCANLFFLNILCILHQFGFILSVAACKTRAKQVHQVEAKTEHHRIFSDAKARRKDGCPTSIKNVTD